jgi:glycosyltransferase involved in cell wall biosynthesis
VKTNKPLVSIVIPCYNSESTIQETLESALNQSHDNLEIVLHDNCSNDMTEKYILEFSDPRIRYHKSNTVLTVSQSWTAATMLASGEYLLLLHSDDLLNRNAISVLLKNFKVNSGIVQTIGQRKLISLNGLLEMNLSFRRAKNKTVLNNKNVIRAVLNSGSNPFGETLVVLFDRSQLVSCLPWSENYVAHIDVDMYLRMSRLGDTLLIPEIIGKWRFGSVNSETNRTRDLFLKEFKQLILENYHYSNMNLPTYLLVYALIKSRAKHIVRRIVVRTVGILRL